MSSPTLRKLPEPTDCPLCLTLCLGPSILPCGHLLCRKCLRAVLECGGHHLTCPSCTSCGRCITSGQGKTIGQLVNDMPKDPILEDMVSDVLAGLGDVVCLACPHKAATRICLDCGEMYCAGCSHSHQRMGISRDHVQQDLPKLERKDSQTRLPSPSASTGHIPEDSLQMVGISGTDGKVYLLPSSPAPESHIICTSYSKEMTQTVSTAVFDHKLGLVMSGTSPVPLHFVSGMPSSGPLHVVSADEPPGNVLHCVVPTKTHPVHSEHPFCTAPESALSITPRLQQLDPSAKILKMEAAVLQEWVRRLTNSEYVLDANILQLIEVKRKLQKQQELLVAYITRLTNPDDRVLQVASALVPRLKRVRESCRQVPEACLTTLTRHINNLMQPGTGGGAVGIPYDPLTAIPTTAFIFKPDCVGDTCKQGPMISCFVAIDDGRLAMSDRNNRMIKLVDLCYPAKQVTNVKLPAIPFRIGLLRDGQLAVTADKKRIYIVDVCVTPTVTSHVKTQRQYLGVGSVFEDDTLVVSTEKDMDGPASLDILTRSGSLVKSFANGNTIFGLTMPYNLCVMDKCVWVSDFCTAIVFQLELPTGRVVGAFTHPELDSPCQVSVDRAGNCYIASLVGRCVLVVTPTGQWRRLIGPEHVNSTVVNPWGVCVMDWGVVVTWEVGGYTVVSGHTLT